MIDVLDSARDLHPVRADLLTDQELRELGRIEALRHHLGARTHYAVDVTDGRLRGLLPVYPTPAGVLPPVIVRGLLDGGGPAGWSASALLGSDASGASMFRFRDTGQAGELLDAALAVAGDYRPDLCCLPLLDDEQYAAVASRVPGVFAGERHDAHLEVAAGSFADYVMALPTRRRVQVRRERRAFLSSALVVEERPVTDAVELAPLLHQVERRHGAPSTVEWERDYLRGVGAAMGGAGVALVASLAGRPVATTVLWDVGSHWRVRCWGCDYSVPEVRDAYAYFNLMFYEPIRRAAAAGGRRIAVGSGSLEGKRRRGARMRRLRSLGWPVGAESDSDGRRRDCRSVPESRDRSVCAEAD
jgi:hypothetical protein